ncbi:Fructosamine kinase-domain-containing protein [Chaetomium strumarium]|uniref:protein-ribulosamine 3-kinase n=1 Tax=Chaetomium strumarium TaxID=1170767 RepID=A0AAJ0M1K9_9PEZI|nr:Fructosamine kinase-domain-containing protein [Chaetomium strumarium]
MSLWGKTGKITAELPDGQLKNYFLKTASLGDTGRAMMFGEYESLKAIRAVSPAIVPEPYAWGKYDGSGTYFLVAEYREVGEQPPNPIRFTKRLAEMHKKSLSPTGKFRFHVTTCHAKLPQITDCWEDSWAVLYRKQLAHMINLDEQKHSEWPEFKIACQLVLDKVIPRLLEPLQSDGRSITPYLVHGDLWDENTATDMATGEPFTFDAGSFYGHNEYEIGNWRAARHRLSAQPYVKGYLREFPASHPEEEWDDRNLLYSLRFDLGTAILIHCNQRQIVKENMAILCNKFFPNEYAALKNSLTGQPLRANPGLRGAVTYTEEAEKRKRTRHSGRKVTKTMKTTNCRISMAWTLTMSGTTTLLSSTRTGGAKWNSICKLLRCLCRCLDHFLFLYHRRLYFRILLGKASQDHMAHLSALHINPVCRRDIH